MSANFESFEELYKKRKDWVESNRKNDFEDGILNLLTELYPDNAHFIYELLQNAEDAEASEIHFSLSESCLIVKHNAKRQFTFEDVNSITGIGNTTKKDDVVQIGKFGVGFKAVFSYTTSPRVFSNQYSFEIRDLVIPHKINNNYEGHYETIFEFPFNSSNKLPKDAFIEIKKGLDTLSVKILLFLQNIKKITWEIESHKTATIRKVNEIGDYISIEKKSRDGLITLTHWLRFNRWLQGYIGLCVSIAYKLDYKTKNITEFNPKKGLDEQFKIVIDLQSNVSVYFPAEKETSNLKFNINAPFASTVARDSIQNRPENEILIEEIAKLTADSLSLIKNHKMLNASVFDVLPNSDDNISEFYLPIRNRVNKAFHLMDLVPCKNENYLSSHNVYESPSSFRAFFKVNDLKYFVERKEEKINWLVPIQGGRQKQFISDLRIHKWGIEELYSFLDTVAGEGSSDSCDFDEDKVFRKWLLSKEIKWIKDFYCFLLKECDAEDDYGDQPIDGVSLFSILLTTKNKLVRAKDCYFPTKLGQGEIHILNSNFFPNKKEDVDEKTNKFFNAIGVNTYGEKEKVNSILEKHYRKESITVTTDERISHIKLFINYFLNENNQHDVGLFKSTHFIYVERDGKNYYADPAVTYLPESYIELNLSLYFKHLPNKNRFAVSDAYLNSGIEIGSLVNFFKWVGCISNIGIIETHTSSNPEARYLRGSCGKRTSYEVNKDYTITNLKIMLSSNSIEVSKFLLNLLNNSYNRYNYSRAKYRPNQSEGFRYAESFLLFNLKSTSWIPTKDGRFLSPRSITSKLIHSEFSNIKNKELLEDIELFSEENKLIASSDEKQQKAQELGFETSEKYERAKWFADLSESEQVRFMDEVANRKENENEPPNYTSRNPEHRESRIREEVQAAPLKEKQVRERSVAVNKNEVIEQAKEYLVAQYTDPDGIQICQVCIEELPFRKLKDGEYYFESIEFDKENKKSIYQNYLCLCPLHSAMFKHANEYTGSLTGLLDLAENNRIEIKLAGEIESIYFTDIHLLDLKTIVEGTQSITALAKDIELSKKLESDTTATPPSSLSDYNEKKIEIRGKYLYFMGVEFTKEKMNWKSAYLYPDSKSKWCLSSRASVVTRFDSQREAEDWWSAFAEYRRVTNSYLIMQKPPVKKSNVNLTVKPTVAPTSTSYGYSSEKGTCPVCGGTGGGGGNCYKCEGTGWA